MADEEDFAKMLAEFEGDAPAKKRPRVGDQVKGRIVSIGADAVFVALGTKAEGVLEREQVLDADNNLTVKVGDVIEATVVNIDYRAGGIQLRRMGARGVVAPAELEQAHAHGFPVEGVVSGVIKGGVEVQVAGQRGFCPASQMELRFVDDLSQFVGKRFEFRITKLEMGKNRIDMVLSRRALLEEEQSRRAVETRQQLAVGAVMRGTVTTIKPYGAFVDLGGLEGMLHVSELGHTRVASPGEVLHTGQTVEVQVLEIKQGDKGERISLSLKSLEKDPWEDAAERWPEGTRLRGKVVRLQPFGAFVELAPGVEGLIHVSELSADKRIQHPREAVKLGQEVDVRVLGVDLERRRISLSALPGEDGESIESFPGATAPTSLGTLRDLLASKLKK